jgi:hypothetical protein
VIRRGTVPEHRGIEPTTVELPIKTGGGLNDRVHWSARAKSSRTQRGTADMLLRQKLRPWGDMCTVTLTRISAGELDDDNLAGSLKSVRDGVTDALGLKSDRDPRVHWRYAQQKCKRGSFGVRVHIEPV